ncbi:MAG: cation transporter [Thermosynechococcaceae cyanobacterium MS004]|nr:cation transporter [Thermosynechococcaceae cyanobacterium MS004]
MTLCLNVPSMACSACSSTITNIVKSLDPAAAVQADLKTKQVIIETEAAEATIIAAVTAAGYAVV